MGRLQKFKVGDLVEMTKPVDYSLPDHDIGLILQVIESVPNQALRVGFCSDGKEVWVAGYRLKKIG
jgi:hypothetical protein